MYIKFTFQTIAEGGKWNSGHSKSIKVIKYFKPFTKSKNVAVEVQYIPKFLSVLFGDSCFFAARTVVSF